MNIITVVNGPGSITVNSSPDGRGLLELQALPSSREALNADAQQVFDSCAALSQELTNGAIAVAAYGRDEVALSGRVPQDEWAAFSDRLRSIAIPASVYVTAMPFRNDDGTVSIASGL